MTGLWSEGVGLVLSETWLVSSDKETGLPLVRDCDGEVPKMHCGLVMAWPAPEAGEANSCLRVTMGCEWVGGRSALPRHAPWVWPAGQDNCACWRFDLWEFLADRNLEPEPTT